MSTMQFRLALQILYKDRFASLHRDIAAAAYYRAKQRGFTPGHELDDWLAAEREILAFNGESANAIPRSNANPSAQSPQGELTSVGNSMNPTEWKQLLVNSTA